MANEKRLLDANDFLDKLSKLAELMRQGEIGEIDLNLLIASMPTVDAVEVVRCKDCRIGSRNTPDGFHWPDGFVWCTRYKTIMNSCDFCSYGERRTDNG